MLQGSLIVDQTVQNILTKCRLHDVGTPYEVFSNGGCLFDSVFVSLCGTQEFSTELRVRTAIEMIRLNSRVMSLPVTPSLITVSPNYFASVFSCASPGGVHIRTNVSTKVNAFVSALNAPNITNYAIDISRCSLDLSGITSLMFEIKACANGNILLSNSNVRNSSKPLYEILIGDSNYYSIIAYRTDDSFERGSYMYNESITRDILNCTVYLPFWISWADGDIKLGTGILVDQNVLVSLMNPHHFEMRSIGVLTSHYKLGKWTIQVEDKFTGYFDSCSMDNTKSDMAVVGAITCSAMRCATSCGMSKTCMGYNFNSAINRCELLSFESNVVTDIPNHLEAGWRFYSKCNNGKTACLGCCI
ncbi:Hypothetical predicted protein [Mytilus galloprovincialis]|uniref:Farnesoic acid O-methyl transferase domain-containing protein n=1 Tax=Mytilus galloprovincialis TaxID=29158 RepID=A0A8B6DRH2_MYTGA|nr:Hypothetical predicted protein [Mytilus galloprovincialis]